MSFVKLNWHPKTKDLRSFGGVFLCGFAATGLIKYFWPFERMFTQNKTVGIWFIGIGLVVGAVGLTGTKLALPFYWAWLGIAWLFGNIMSRVIVTMLYYLLFTPMRLMNNLIGRDKLQLNKPDTDSYWLPISLPSEPEKYERQF
jgi:hypothetical protein